MTPYKEKLANEVNRLYSDGKTIGDIAAILCFSERHITKVISDDRKINPEKWPSRRVKKKPSILVHRYECQECVVHFMVERFEGLMSITCPVCNGDDIEDLGPGVVSY